MRVCFLLCVADAATEEERARLEIQGEFHLGEFVNKFCRGSLLMQARTDLFFLRVMRTVATRVERCWRDRFVDRRAMGRRGATVCGLVVEGGVVAFGKQAARHVAIEVSATAAANLIAVFECVSFKMYHSCSTSPFVAPLTGPPLTTLTVHRGRQHRWGGQAPCEWATAALRNRERDGRYNPDLDRRQPPVSEPAANGDDKSR